MPQFLLDSKGEIDTQGILDESPIQLVGHLLIPHKLRKLNNGGDLYSALTNEDDPLNPYIIRKNGIDVGVSDYGIGRFLVSSGFGPCQAVVAYLADGNYALFHASNHNPNFIFHAFINDIAQRGVTRLMMFEKINIFDKTKAVLYRQQIENYATRAFTLHDSLQTALNNKSIAIEVERFQVDNYFSIAVDAAREKVFVANARLVDPEEKDFNPILLHEEKDFATPITKKITLAETKEAAKKNIKAREDEAMEFMRSNFFLKAEEKAPPKKVKTHFVRVKPVLTNRHLQQIQDLIEKEMETLAKTFLGMRLHYNSNDKIKVIQIALNNAIDQFPNFTWDNIHAFLEFKKDASSKSIKEALEMPRYGKKISSMYENFCKKLRVTHSTVELKYHKP